MDSVEFIAKAYDSDAFTTAQTSAGYINPEVWNKEVLAHVQQNLVVAPLGKQYNDLLDTAGDTLNITIGVEPSVAAAVAESAAVGIDAYTKTQVQFIPTEYGKAYQLTNKEKSRSFINLMQDMTAELGYGLALEKDTLCIALFSGSAGNTMNANGVITSNMASSDTLDYDDIVRGRIMIFEDKLTPYAVVMGYEVYGQLLQLQAVRDVSQFGGNVAQNGYLGRISGLDAYLTQGITSSSHKIKTYILGKDARGLPPFGIAQKRNPYLETQYHALERYTDIVAVEEYQVKLLRANGVCAITSYGAV